MKNAMTVDRSDMTGPGGKETLHRQDGRGGVLVYSSARAYGSASASERDKCTEDVLARLDLALPSDRSYVRDTVFRMFDVPT